MGSTASKMSLAGKKAWATRRANLAALKNVSASSAKTVTARRSTATSSTDRSLTLSGTRKLRASATTLVGRVSEAKSIEYYYGEKRSVIVLHN